MDGERVDIWERDDRSREEVKVGSLIDRKEINNENVDIEVCYFIVLYRRGKRG